MTEQEKFFEEETLKHIDKVRHYLMFVSSMLKYRGNNHDKSKLSEPERSIFIEYTPKLRESTYGSDEYKGYLKEMNVALKHHYDSNRHHPEHYKNGLDDMNLVDLVEMFFDWLAATKRHADGNIHKSIETNKERFNYNDQMASIFTNTANMIDTALFDVVESVFTSDDNDNVRTLVYDWFVGGVSLSSEEVKAKYNKEDLDNARSITMTLISMGLG